MRSFFNKPLENNDRLSQIVAELNVLAMKNTIFEDDLNLELIEVITLEICELIDCIKLDKIPVDDLKELLESDNMPSMMSEKISKSKQAFNNAPEKIRLQSEALINELHQIFIDKHKDYLDLVKEKIKAEPAVIGKI